MSDTDSLSISNLSATPSEAEIDTWRALPRDEQLRRLRLEMDHPDARVAGADGMAEIWAKIHERRAARRTSHGDV